MPASVSDVQYLTLVEACKIIPGRPHKNTLIRWCDRGYGGVILESWRCGNRRVTSIEAIDTFIAQTSGVPHHRTTSAHKRAEAELDAMGVE